VATSWDLGFPSPVTDSCLLNRLRYGPIRQRGVMVETDGKKDAVANTSGATPVERHLDPSPRLAEWLRTLPDRGVATVAFILLLAFYLLSTPTVRTEADDAYQFSYEVENGLVAEGISRQILYVPVATAVFEGVQALGWDGRALGVLVVLSALFAAASVSLLYLLLRRRLGASRATAALGSGALAFTYGYWRYAAEAEVYSIAIFLALTLLYVAFADSTRTAVWGGIGVLGATAYLMHGLNVVVAFAAVPVFLIGVRKYRQLVAYGAVLVALVLLGSVTAYVAAREDDQSFRDFYSENTEITLSVNNAQRALVGSGQSLIASGFLFSHDRFPELVEEITPNRFLEDDLYLAATITPARRWAMTATFVAALGAILSAVALAIPGLVQLRRNPQLMAIVVWLIGITVFQITSGFGADGPEVWLLALPALALTLAMGVGGSESYSRPGMRVLGLVVLIFAVHNGLGMATLQADDGDRNVARAEWLLGNTTSRDLVLTLDSAQFARYLQYKSEATVVNLLEAAVADRYIDAITADAASEYERVLATAAVFDPPAWVTSGWPEFEQLVTSGEAMRDHFTVIAEDEFGGIFLWNGTLP